MAGESIRDSGAWVTLEANGASIANAAYGEANDAAFSLSADGGNRPHLEFELEFAQSANASGVPFLSVLARDLDLFGGPDDAQAPSATVPGRLVRTVLGATAATTTQRYRFDAMVAPQHASYWLYNGSGQSVAAGWKLRARAWSLKAA